MQISCERCNTVYVLDDKLIPAGGAPVQCTRCGLVFTARPPAGAVAAPPPPKPSAPPPSAARTQVFGGVASPQPQAPAPSAHATQMFGGAPAAPAPAPSVHSTQMFGAGAAAPAPAPSTPAPNVHSTMMFGSAPSVAAPAAPAAPPAASPHATMVFGGAPQPSAGMPAAPAPSVPARSTQVFGAAGSAPAPVAPARVAAPLNPNSTMMFGGQAPAQPAKPTTPAPQSATSTMMFGTAPPAASPAPASSNPNSTMMFGAAPPAAQAPAPAPAASPNPNSTMVFGAVAKPAAAADDGERAPAVEMPSVPSTPGRRPVRPTPVMPPPEAAPLRQPESQPEPSPEDDTPPPEPAAQAPSWMAPEQPEEAPAPAAPARRPPSRKPAPAPAPLPVKPAAPAEPLVGSQTMELQMSLKKRQRTLPMVLAVLAILGILGGGAAVYLKNRVPSADPALVAADGKALELFKADDTESLKAALAAWKAIEAKSPDFVPAVANQLMAHVLLNQDLRDEILRVRGQAAGLESEMRKLMEKKEPADWLAKANALRAQLIEIKTQVDTLQDEAAKHDERAGELLKLSKSKVEKLGQAGDGTAVFRASALYYAVKGHETAEKLADFYRKNPDERKVLHDDPRAFGDLAIAGMHAQPRISPERRDKGIAGATKALEKDPKLLRAHLFAAKIYLANKEYPEAKAAVEKLLAANPAHKAGAKLKQDVEQAAAAAAAKKAKAAELEESAKEK